MNKSFGENKLKVIQGKDVWKVEECVLMDTEWTE